MISFPICYDRNSAYTTIKGGETVFSEYPYTNFSDLNLDWVIKEIKKFMAAVEDLETWKTQHEAEYEELKELYDAVMSGDFPPSIENAFKVWMRKNANELVGEMVKNVFFGLTEAGYFVAYIPETWDDIIFNTAGYDINIPYMTNAEQFGRLVLSY